MGASLTKLGRFQEAYGDVVRIWLGPETLTLLLHPDHVQRVLQTHQKQYVRAGYGYEFDLLADLMRRPGRVSSREQLLERVWG